MSLKNNRYLLQLCLAWFVILLSITPASAEDKDKFLKAAREYISENSTPDEESRWSRKWKEHVETMLNDRNATDEESALKRVVFDWFADNGGKWRKDQDIPKKDRIQMCRYYIICRTKGYTMPSQIEEHLTDENLQKFMDEKKK